MKEEIQVEEIEEVKLKGIRQNARTNNQLFHHNGIVCVVWKEWRMKQDDMTHKQYQVLAFATADICNENKTLSRFGVFSGLAIEAGFAKVNICTCGRIANHIPRCGWIRLVESESKQEK